MSKRSLHGQSDDHPVMEVKLDAASSSNIINTPQEEGRLLYHLKERSLII